MKFVLFDGACREQFLPLTYTRPVADIRCGILTIRERWELLLGAVPGSLTADYLQQAFPSNAGTDNIFISSTIIADKALAAAISRLEQGQALVKDEHFIAARIAVPEPGGEEAMLSSCKEKISYTGLLLRLRKVWDIFSLNDTALRQDFALLTENRASQALPGYVTALNPSGIFVEEGARLYPCIINAETGPVYIGRDAEIMEGAVIRGPVALGTHASLKMGAKVYGATTIGPGCKVGGEISNVVFFANSNKGHDGFLGNSVIGEWCNLGADTNCSNLKNNYDEVKIWSEHEQKMVKTGLQFCGLIMGDHSKCGINTMFNTGTVVGVSCNIYGGGFPEKFIPSFSWGGSEGIAAYRPDKAIDTANRMMARRNRQLSPAEAQILLHLFSTTENQRNIATDNPASN